MSPEAHGTLTPRSRLTARGWCVLVVAAVTTPLGWYTHLATLLTIGIGAFLLLGYAIAMRVWVHRAIKVATIRVIRSTRPALLTRATPAVVTVNVTGQKIARGLVTRLDATLHDAVEKHLAADAGAVTLRVCATGWEASYAIEPWARGRWPLGPVTMSFTDFLGVITTRVIHPSVTPIAVRPRAAQVAPDSSAAERSTGMLGDAFAAGARVSNPEDSLLREYVPGDDVRRVHWPTTARRQTLMVRSDEHTPAPAVRIVLDPRLLDPTVLSVPPGTTYAEWPIDVTATLAVGYAMAGRQVVLSTSGGSTINSVEAEAGTNDTEALLEALTDVPSGPCFASVEQVTAEILAEHGGITIAIVAPFGTELAPALASADSFASAHMLRFIVAAPVPGDESPGLARHQETVELLNQAGWVATAAHLGEHPGKVATRVIGR